MQKKDGGIARAIPPKNLFVQLFTGLIWLFVAFPSGGQTIILSNFAGSGLGYVDGPLEIAKFSNPLIEPVEDGTIWVLDSGNNRVRKIADGAVSTVCQITRGPTPIPVSRTGIGGGLSVTYSRKLGFLWSEPGLLHQIKNGADRIICGTRGSYGNSGLLLGKALSIVADSDGDILIADADYDVIRKFITDDSGANPQTDTVAGSSPMGHIDGAGRQAHLNWPQTIQKGDDGFWFYETFNACIRHLDTSWVVTTPDYLRERGAGIFDLGDRKLLLNRVETIETNNYSRLSILYKNGVEIATPSANGEAFPFIYGFRRGADGKIYCASSADGKLFTLSIIIPESTPTLTAQQFCGVTITGDLGRTYRIESADSAEGPWRENATVSLTKSPQTWIDESSQGPAKRFYRAVLLP